MVFPLTFMLMGLCFFHSSLICSNFTTLEIMKGGKLICPCLPIGNPNKRFPQNQFDRGVIANIK